MEYPVDRNGAYEIFELPEGMNHLSGPNTLKYARSRHSTSDFSRSKRQQSIIKAIVSKMMSSENFSISKMKELYATYTSIIKTNISLDQIL
jgi:anionic cell wall polymer biosynthesis LytR-Cps2A-Psr (LCP) family protein